MNLRNALLGTTAMLGAAALVVPSSASAFDVNIRGFFNFNTVLGSDIDAALGRNSRSYDFTTDSEIHIEGVNVDDETGIRYGMLVEFETDPQNGLRTEALGDPDTTDDDRRDTGGAVIDESYMFVQGGFGGFRLGNEDGAVDNSKIGAYNIAAGTGGIDGQAVVASVRFAPHQHRRLDQDPLRLAVDRRLHGSRLVHAERRRRRQSRCRSEHRRLRGLD